jgi:hypothetical protein
VAENAGRWSVAEVGNPLWSLGESRALSAWLPAEILSVLDVMEAGS